MGSLVKKYGWHEWICHTNFSFLIGASYPHELIQKAIQYEYQSLAITDYDGIYGIARAYRDRERLREANPSQSLKLHYGAEIHLACDHQYPKYS